MVLPNLFTILWLVFILNHTCITKTAMIFSLGVFLVLIVPFIKPFITFIPRYGEKVLDAFDYIPFAYLTDKMISSNFDFSNWQWVISLGSIVIFFILNILYVAKKTFNKNNFEVGNFKFSQPQSLSYCKFIYFLIYLGWNYKLLSKMKRQFYSGLI